MLNDQKDFESFQKKGLEVVPDFVGTVVIGSIEKKFLIHNAI